MSEWDDLYRHCVHCGTDCIDFPGLEPDHADHCPSVTGLWPVREEEQMPCPHCGEPTREMSCMDCGADLKPGNFYVLRDSSTGSVSVRPHIGEVICVGCGAREAGSMAEPSEPTT